MRGGARGLAAIALWGAVTNAGLWAKAPAAPVVHAHLDRTAMWIADRLTYSVDIVCPKGIDVLADDVSKDKLRTEGLDVLSADTSVTTASDESTTHHIDYHVTTYRADVPTLTIAPLRVRYFVRRPGQRLQDEAPAGEFEVPAADIAFRSTLPDRADTAALRDGRAPLPRARTFASARAIGLALIVLSAAPLAFVAAEIVRRRRPRTGKSVRRIKEEERVTYGELQAMDLSTAEGRRRAYDGIDTLVRAHLRDVLGVSGPAATPAEIPALLNGRNGTVPPETIAALLAACERARYAPPTLMPPADECRQAIEETGSVLAVTRR